MQVLSWNFLYQLQTDSLVTATSKLLEMCLPEILQMYLITHNFQFGFKTKHYADMYTFIVKKTLSSTFLDTSEALDRVTIEYYL